MTESFRSSFTVEIQEDDFDEGLLVASFLFDRCFDFADFKDQIDF